MRPRDRRVRAVAAQIDEQDFVVGLALDELPRGGHPVAGLSHYTVQAYNNSRFSKGGLAFQSAARDPLVREDGHPLFFSVLSSAALAVIAAAASRAATESGVVASQSPRECAAWSRPGYRSVAKRAVLKPIPHPLTS